MLSLLTFALIASSVALALWVLVYLVIGRNLDDPMLYAFGLLEVGLLVQLLVGVVQLIGTDRDVNGVVFVSYLLGVLVVPPLAVLWSLGERSRAGTAVLLLAAVLVPFLVLRLQAVWGG